MPAGRSCQKLPVSDRANASWGRNRLIVRVVRCRNSLPREIVDAPCLGMFKASLDGLWTTWSSERCPCSWQECWNEMSFKAPSHPFCGSMIRNGLWFQDGQWDSWKTVAAPPHCGLHNPWGLGQIASPKSGMQQGVNHANPANVKAHLATPLRCSCSGWGWGGSNAAELLQYTVPSWERNSLNILTVLCGDDSGS